MMLQGLQEFLGHNEQLIGSKQSLTWAAYINSRPA